MRIIPLRYRGRRDPNPIVEIQQIEDGPWFPFDARLGLGGFVHGLDWGHHGAGPAQLALAILASRVSSVEAVARHQAFKVQVIAGLPDEWEMEGAMVDGYLTADGAFRVAQERHGLMAVFRLQVGSAEVN